MISIGLIGALIVIAAWSYMDRPEPVKKVKAHAVQPITQNSTIEKVERLLGPRLTGDRPTTVVWVDSKSGVLLSEEFIFQSDKIKTEKAQADARAKLRAAGYIRMTEHCRGITNTPNAKGYFTAGYCTYTPVDLTLLKG